MSMTAVQTLSDDEDHVMWLKALEKAGKWTLSWDSLCQMYENASIKYVAVTEEEKQDRRTHSDILIKTQASLRMQSAAREGN